jgi:carboxymethylenebutenolidase
MRSCDVSEREIRVQTEEGSMTVFAVHPDGEGPFPVAVIYMDAPGYRDAVKEHARRFGADGYYCLLPDLFYRAGEKLTMAEAGDETIFALVRSLTPEMVVADTNAALDAIADDPAASGGPKVCAGYCMGGKFALYLAAARGDVVAAAGIHPGALVADEPDSPHLVLPQVRGELYYAFAENDRTATEENVARFRQAIEEAGVRGTVERLPGTSHGFALADRPVYDRDASEHHFERTLDLWRRNVSAVAT